MNPTDVAPWREVKRDNRSRMVWEAADTELERPVMRFLLKLLWAVILVVLVAWWRIGC